jgi:hypothetical protein
MAGSGHQGKGHTIRRRPPEAAPSAGPERLPPPPTAGERPPLAQGTAERRKVIPESSSKLPIAADPVPSLAELAARIATAPRPVQLHEALKVGGHLIRLERDDDRVHLVLGGVFRLVMTLEEAEQLAGVLTKLTAPR